MSYPKQQFKHLYSIPSRNGLMRPKKVRGSGYKMVNMGELFAYDRIQGQEMELVPMNEKEIERFAIQPFDLLFARSSLKIEGTGKCSIVLAVPETTTFESHLIRVRLDRRLANPTFYYYYFSSWQGKANVQSIVMQVSAAGIRASELGLLSVPTPPLPTQHKIASILSAYDDLIENNTRRIAILEEMAQSIYREWFVHFRFSGHENVKLVDSPLGMIPEGWECSQVSEVFETFGGGTPSKKVEEYWDDGDITWFAPSDLTKSGNMYSSSSGTCITESGLKKSSAKLFPAYSVMLTSRATIGVLSISTIPACTNQGFITCIPNERVSALQLFFWLREQTAKILNFATGATFKEITKGNFRKFSYLVPPPDVSEQFNELAAPIGRNIETLIRKQDNLRTTRDLLLPKLISGKLDVEDLDIDVGMTATQEAVA